MRFEVPKMNMIENIVQSKALVSNTFIQEELNCIPRPQEASLLGRARVKTPWDFYKSVFKTYKSDNPKILDDCFEIDWA